MIPQGSEWVGRLRRRGRKGWPVPIRRSISKLGGNGLEAWGWNIANCLFAAVYRSRLHMATLEESVLLKGAALIPVVAIGRGSALF